MTDQVMKLLRDIECRARRIREDKAIVGIEASFIEVTARQAIALLAQEKAAPPDDEGDPDVIGTDFEPPPSAAPYAPHLNERGEKSQAPMFVHPALRERIANEKALCEQYILAHGDALNREAALREKREGWVMVPREPTAEMLDAAQRCDVEGEDDALRAWGTLYKAMLSAAPREKREGIEKELESLRDQLEATRQEALAEAAWHRHHKERARLFELDLADALSDDSERRAKAAKNYSDVLDMRAAAPREEE